MNQHAELDALRLGNRSLEPSQLAVAKLFFGNGSDGVHQIHEALVDRNRMSSKSILGGVLNRERRNTRERFHRRDGFAQVLFFEELKVELIVFFEDAMQRFFDSSRGFGRLADIFHQLRQFSARRYADFVPVIEVFLKLGECFVGSFERRIFKNGAVDHVLQNRSVRGRRDQRVFFFGNLVKFGQQVSAFFCRHGGNYLGAWVLFDLALRGEAKRYLFVLVFHHRFVFFNSFLAVFDFAFFILGSFLW